VGGEVDFFDEAFPEGVDVACVETNQRREMEKTGGEGTDRGGLSRRPA
jgi:hypothetical protein